MKLPYNYEYSIRMKPIYTNKITIIIMKYNPNSSLVAFDTHLSNIIKSNSFNSITPIIKSSVLFSLLKTGSIK